MRKSKLDRIDARILSVLQLSGRMSNLKLAEAVGLSPNPCLDRRKRLERAGYITRYLTEVDPIRLDEHVAIVFAQITLQGHTSISFERFERAVHSVPEIVECHKVRGGVDYLVKFVCANITEYRKLSERLLRAKLSIGHYVSYVVIEPVKPFSGHPIDLLSATAK